jgi:transcriptional regulator with PAS, ATPase and Fis domain
MEYVRTGGFREDLFYRLNVINLQIPSLRQRVQDIVPLAEYFITKYAALNGVEEKGLSQEAKQKLLAYSWPGNVRELENCMHRSLLLSHNMEIEASDVMLIGTQQDNRPVFSDDTTSSSLEVVERRAIYDALIRSQGDQLKASLVLGVSIQVLQDKLKKHKII